MKKVRKGKKMLITALIVVIVVIAIILIVVQVRKNNKPSTPTEEDNQVIALPKTTYSGLTITLSSLCCQQGIKVMIDSPQKALSL